jgi:hypothetical protein
MLPLEPLPVYRVVAPVVIVLVALVFCLLRPMPFLRIVMVCIIGLSVYGMAQDQISVRLCPEYFTVAHPPIIGLNNLTLLGMAWGFLGAWWGGLMIGLALAPIAILGQWPRLSAHELIRPVMLMALVIAAGTVIAGAGGYFNGELVGLTLGEPWASKIPPERHLRFFAVACAHFGTYASATLAAVALCIWTSRQRKLKARVTREFAQAQSVVRHIGLRFD